MAVDRGSGDAELVSDLLDGVIAGVVIHDCAAKAPGRRRLPHPAQLSSEEGIGVTWTQHDASESELGYGVYKEVQETMNFTVVDALGLAGFTVEEFGSAGAHRVTGRRPPEEQSEPAGEEDDQ